MEQTPTGDTANGGVDAETRYLNVHRYAEVDWYTSREVLAIRLAESYALNHTSIDDAFFAELRAEFSDSEILDLLVCISSFLALGRMMQVLDVAVDCPIEL